MRAGREAPPLAESAPFLVVPDRNLGMIEANLLAFACFGGAGTLLYFGTRGLLRVMRGDPGVSALRSQPYRGTDL